MQPATITCDSHASQSARCGETALVRAVSYVYARERESAAPVLREAHYQIDCPRCGQRTQIERFE
jgi:hypothetical protein